MGQPAAARRLRERRRSTLGCTSCRIRVSWLDGRPITVVIGLVYGYVPFFILPLYAALDRIDRGCSRRPRPRRRRPGDVPAGHAAAVGAGDPGRVGHHRAADVRRLLHQHLLSGSPRTEMVGNQIEFYLLGRRAAEAGASLVLVLSAMLLVLMAYYLVITVPAAEGRRRTMTRRIGVAAAATPVRAGHVTWLYILWSLVPVLIAILLVQPGTQPLDLAGLLDPLVVGRRRDRSCTTRPARPMTQQAEAGRAHAW